MIAESDQCGLKVREEDFDVPCGRQQCQTNAGARIYRWGEGAWLAEAAGVVGGEGGAGGGAPQFCEHFSGLTNASLIFFRYSGYIVSAPPRVASRGMPYNFVSSSIDGFVPGR